MMSLKRGNMNWTYCMMDSPTCSDALIDIVRAGSFAWADSTGGCNTLKTAQAVGVLQMKQRRRIYYSEKQKALMWERWQKGESLQHIAQLFDRNHSSVQRILAETGGIRPAQRHRSRLALTLAEREEISRALVAGDSIQSIARCLSRAPSTICREIKRTADRTATEQTMPSSLPGIGHSVPKPVNWLSTERWRTSWQASSSCSGHRSRLPDGSGVRTRPTRTTTRPTRPSTAASSSRPVAP